MNSMTGPLIGIVIGAGALIGAAVGTSNAAPEVPVETVTVAPVVEPAPEPPASQLPSATTVIGAVVAGLATQCANVNGSITNPDNWMLWDPNAVNHLGYWEVAANSTSGLVVLRVMPQDGHVYIYPYNAPEYEAYADATQAFAEWQCPESLDVLKEQ